MPLQVSPLGGNGRKPRTIYPLIVIPLLAIVLITGTLTLYLRNFAHAAPADRLVPLAGTTPAVLAHSKLDGPTNPKQSISLSIALRLRNADMLKSYVDDISHPKSSNYHRYLTTMQFQAAFSPSLATHNAILQYLSNAGFTIAHIYKQRMSISFTGTVGLAEQVFHVTMNNYTAVNGLTFYANTADPLLPSSLVGSVLSITGLNNASHQRHSPIRMRNASSSAAGKARPNSISCPVTGSNYYLPSQLAAAYNLNGLYNANYRGEGQSVALFELDSTTLSDISNYRSCFDQNSPTSVQVIPIDGGPPTPQPNDNGPVEVNIDAELVLSAAPKLGNLIIYEAPNSIAALNDEWNQIIQDGTPVVSTSWGECESDLNSSDPNQFQTENQYFQTALAQGQTVFAASGDSGSSACLFDNINLSNTQLNTDDPASQPAVTGVGGTSLTLNGTAYVSETVWNNQPTNVQSPQGGASGGGYSINFAKPNWQVAPGVNSGNRQVPDVSINADLYNKGYLIYCTVTASGCSSGQPWVDAGGTSCGAPMWAAMMAMANEESVKAGGFNMGFINPLLYQIANNSNGTSYNNDFHDVTSGNNDYNFLHNGQYAAGSAFDLATGLGSYNAANLAADLVRLTTSNRRAAPASMTWYFAEGSAGGNFQEYLTVQNPDPTQVANISITYLIQGNPPSTKVVNYSVNPSSRQTFDVDHDLSTTPTGPHYSVAAIIHVTSGPAIVAERPMYFNILGAPSGTDVVGATAPGRSYYFPEADSRQVGQTNYNTFLTMLNPSSSTAAHVTITYYTGNCVPAGLPACPTEQRTLQPLERQTANPNDAGVGLHQKLAIAISSDQNIVVERPMYFTDNISNAGGFTTGAASEVGASAPGNDWLFAEGYTGSGFQEYYELANYSSIIAHANVKLEYTNGDTQTVQVTVPAFNFYQFDVNNANAHPGTCNPAPCAVTNSVSAEITSDNPIVADRLMLFHFGSAHISGGTDVVGTPAANSVYAFAEGYTGGQFQEFLTLQNPTSTDEHVAVTLFTPSFVLQQQFEVKAHSRNTVSINNLLNPIGAGSVSMTVQALGSGAVIVAERPEYFIFKAAGVSGTQTGGTNVIGYTGSPCTC